MGRWKSRRGSHCIQRTDTPMDCSPCASTPSVVGVVLASDATHYYENMGTNRPFTTAFHVGQMLDAYRTLARLAPTPRHIIPGHDPYVMREYPAAAPALEGIVVRLDSEPIAPALSFGPSRQA
jgi:glyoxylase-like metal-dependent hydrolase (beta-lactamase superfamily II)